MYRSIKSIILLSLIIIFFPLAAVNSPAARADKVYKLLIVESQEREPYLSARRALLKELSDSGYQEKKNLQVTRFSVGNDEKKAIAILKREAARPYDVIVVSGSVVCVAAKKVLYGKMELKVLFLTVTDPLGIGFIDDFKNPPKANFSGVTYPVPLRSRLQFVLDIMPQVKKMGMVHAEMPQSESYKKWIADALRDDPALKNIQVIYRSIPLIKGDDANERMAETAKKHILELDSQVDVFLGSHDQLSTQRPMSAMVAKVATKPFVGIVIEDILEEWGATMAMVPSSPAQGRQCARMIKRLFAGAKIKDIIPELPKENSIAFNLRMAKKYGVKIPVEMIQLAGKNIVK